MPSRPPVIVKTYTGTTQALAAAHFAADAAKAADDGYLPTSQAWEGTTLTVIYQRQEPAQAQPDPEPALGAVLPDQGVRYEPPSRTRPAWSRWRPGPVVNVKQSGGGVAGGMGQGIGFGVGCLLLIGFLVVACVVVVVAPFAA